MPVDHLRERRQQFRQCILVIRGQDIAVHRMEKPKARVSRVIEPFVLAFGKHIRNQPALHVLCEGAQNPCGFLIAFRRQRQAFQADHRVAAPIGEPVIARDHAAQFVAGRARARRIFDATRGHDDELIRRQNEFSRDARLYARIRRAQKPPAPLCLRAKRRLWIKRVHRPPIFRRCDQGDGNTFFQWDHEKSRRP